MSKSNVSVLVVDDDPMMRDTIAVLLGNRGMDVVTQSNVDDAVECLAGREFDLVISDVQMPGKSGIELFRQISADMPDMPFLFMTGAPDLRVAVDALKNGCYDYISKPFMAEDLVEKIHEACRKSETRQRAQREFHELQSLLSERVSELRIYQDVVDSTDDGCLVLDTMGTVVTCNRGCEKIFGVTGKSLVSRSLSAIGGGLLPGIDFAAIIEHVGTKGGQWQFEVGGCGTGGEPRITGVSVSVIRDERGDIFAYAMLLRDVSEQRRMERSLIESLRKTNAAHQAIIFALARLTESRDQVTGDHLERIRTYCQLFTRVLRDDDRYRNRIDDAFVDMIYLTAPLHDVGKVGVPDNILLKPGKLTAEEFAVMKRHTTIGFETLDAIRRQFGDMDFLDMGIQITHCHHERYDGSGYPRGLCGDEIPLPAQILAIADVYDALTSDRPYRKALHHNDAMRIIVDESAAHFSPALLACFAAQTDMLRDVCAGFRQVKVSTCANGSS